MRLEKVPITPIRLPDIKLDLGASPKAPPRVFPRREVVHPVGFEPVDDVVMAGEQRDLPARAAPRLLERERSHLCDLPVDDARELVHHDDGRRLADQPREVGAELLAVRQHGVRAQPRRQVQTLQRTVQVYSVLPRVRLPQVARLLPQT